MLTCLGPTPREPLQRTPPRGVSNFPEGASPRVTTLHDAAAGVRFRIVSSEAVDSANPYVRLFYQALAESGIAANGVFQARTGWLDDHQEEFDAVHFHWPEWIVRRDARWARRLYRLRGGWRLRRPLRRVMPFVNLPKLRGFLRELRSRRKRIIWTCHNLLPHEDRTWAVVEAIRLVAASADLIITHDSHARDECRRIYSPAGHVVVMSHGNYDGVYPDARPAAEVRRDLGLPSSGPVLSCVGQIRPYKDIELACRAVAGLRQPVSLIVAGDAPLPGYLRRVRSHLEELPATVLIDRVLTDQEFADVIGASDAVLMPYRAVTGSSAVLAALTLGRGVVASNLPFFESLLADHPEAGRTFTVGDPSHFVEAITAYLDIPLERRHAAARKLAGEFTWPRVIEPVVRIIDDWCQERER
jgi:beta-1,4-mannosyltransferase